MSMQLMIGGWLYSPSPKVLHSEAFRKTTRLEIKNLPFVAKKRQKTKLREVHPIQASQHPVGQTDTGDHRNTPGENPTLQPAAGRRAQLPRGYSNKRNLLANYIVSATDLQT